MAEEQGQQGSAADGNDVTFTEEQQAHVNTMIADRLSRAKWDEEQKKAVDIAFMSDKQRREHE